MLPLLLALALAAPAAGQEPKSTATKDCKSTVVTSPTPDTGCNFGACKSITSGTLTCAYDSTFCGSTEDWLTAQDVIDAGEECTCEHILNYPNNIGTCSSSGVYSPMALASDCSGGTAVCEAEPGGHYMMGDIQSGVKQFTSCDLKCDASKDHRYDVPTDTYQDCEFYQAQWATLGQAPTGRMYPRRMVMMDDMAVVGGYVKSTSMESDYEENMKDRNGYDFEIRGPFSRSDPDASEGTSVHEDLKAYSPPGRSWDEYEMGFVKVDTTTGVPQDIIHFGGHGEDGLWGIHANSDNTKIVASGYFIGNLTLDGLPTIYTVNGGMNNAAGLGMDGWVATFDANLVPGWLTRWPESGVGSTDSSRCMDVDFDSSDHIYGVGYQCSTDSCVGVMSKMAAADGSQVWEKVFTDAQHFERVSTSNDDSDDFFVRGKLFTTTGEPTAENPTPFGVACAADDCGVIARMSSDGAVIWARTIEGADWSMRYFSGEIELDATGAPYIYVAMKDAAQTGVVSLDSGTPYAGCKDDTTGVVMPAYEVSTAKMVTASDCPSGSTFVDTDSADAVWAASANTGVHCARHSDDGCVMKYHAYTGLPIWASTFGGLDAIVTMADGSLHAIGDGRGVQFDSVYTPDTTTSWTWHAELDATTGKGKSVKAFGSATGSGSTVCYDAASTPGGDLIIAGYSAATSIYFDESFTLTYPEENQETQFMLMKVETSGTKATPSCISTCTNDRSTTVIEAGFCYIDGLCYADGVTGESLGRSCKVCDPSKSQTSWSDGPTLGVTECFIDGNCVQAAEFDYFTDRGGRATGCVYCDVYSECRACDPAQSITEWTVNDGYTATGEAMPNDCLADDTTTDTTDSGDSPDRTTAASGGTLSESDGAQALVAGALAPLAALLL